MAPSWRRRKRNNVKVKMSPIPLASPLTKLCSNMRGIVGTFGALSIIGLVWFLDSFDKIGITSMLLLVIASLFAASIPVHLLNSRTWRIGSIFMCALGIVALLTLTVSDILTTRYIDWVAILLRSLYLLALLVLARCYSKNN